MILTNNKLSDVLDNNDLIYIQDENELLDFIVDMKDIFPSQSKLGMDILITNLTIKGYLMLDDTIHLEVYTDILEAVY